MRDALLDALGGLICIAVAWLLVLTFAGCSWRPALNPERPGVTWRRSLGTMASPSATTPGPGVLQIIDIHAETMYPDAYAACRERGGCR